MAKLTRRSIVSGAMSLPLAFAAQRAFAQSAAGPTISPEDLGWTPDSSPRMTANIINQALKVARETGATYYDNAPRRIAGTVTLGGKVVMEFGSLHSWRAVFDDLSLFTEISEFRGDAYGGSGKFAFVDNAGARGSIIRGPFTLLAARPRNMSLAERRKIPADLVAFTATRRAPSSEMLIESITIEGFGHAFYQGPQNSRNDIILPYTRLNCGSAIIRFCLSPITTGRRGTGLDDAVFTILRLSRNAGVSEIRGTDLNATSFFNYGLSEKSDLEPGSISLEAGSHIAKVQNSAFAPGMVVAALQGGLTANGASIPFVSRVTSVGDGSVTLTDAPEIDFQGPYMIDPPSFVLRNSALNALHLYLEGFHSYPLELKRRAKLSARDIKISGGHLGSQGGYAIAVSGELTSLDIQLNPRSVGTTSVRGIVGLFDNSANPSGQIISPAGDETRLLGDARPSIERGTKLVSTVRGRDGQPIPLN